MKKKYSINEIKKIICRNVLMIIIFMIIGALCAGLYAKKRQITSYTAKADILIGQNINSTNYKNSAVQAGLSMMKTYEKIVENNETMKMAHDSLSHKDRKKIKEGEFQSDVKASSHPDSLILTISSTTGNCYQSIKMTNAVANISKKQINKYSPVTSNVKIISKATKQNTVSVTHPSIKKYVVLGAAIGVLVGMIFSFSLTTWKNDD